MVPDRATKVIFVAAAVALCALALAFPMAVLLVCLLLAAAWLILSRQLPRNLVSDPISLSPNGALERSFDVKVPEIYGLWLEFERHGHSEDELRSLIGFPLPGQYGTVVPIKWSVSETNPARLIASGERQSQSSNSWPGTHVGRFLDRFALPRGRLVFRAEVLHDIPALRNVRAQIRIAFEPSFGHSALNSWSFLLAFLYGYVALPVGIFSLSLLGVRYFAA